MIISAIQKFGLLSVVVDPYEYDMKPELQL